MGYLQMTKLLKMRKS